MLFRKKLLAAIASALVIVGIPGAAQASESDVSNSFSADVKSTTASLFYRCTSSRFITLANGWPTASPTDRSGSRYCWLEVSDLYNNAVTVLQFNLNSAEGMSIDVDGYYGQGTRRAVMQVQRRYNLTPDGEYGPKTGHRMRWRAVNGSVSRWA